jgi:DNA-binding MarR family transcriptional regulator
MMKPKPHPSEIKNTSKIIREKNYLYIARFADIFNRYIVTSMRRDKVNPVRWGILSLIIANGGWQAPTQLALMMNRSKHSMTKIIDYLEREGYVIRERINHDRRVIQVQITSGGLDYVVETMKKGDARLGEIMNSLNEDEQVLLVNLTEKMISKLVEKITSM